MLIVALECMLVHVQYIMVQLSYMLLSCGTQHFMFPTELNWSDLASLQLNRLNQ